MKKLFALFYLATFLIASLAYGHQRGVQIKKDDSERRVALVIGNSAYATSPLLNPVNDARDVAEALGEVGFQVTLKENVGYRDMKRAIQDFGDQIRNGGVGLFYFSGHGVQFNGDNYLIPVDTAIRREAEVEYESVNVGSVLAQMQGAGNRLNIVILDACRNNPFARSFRSQSRGLAFVNAPSGTLISYSTAPGSVASDGAQRNSPYTEALLKYMRSPGLKIEDVFKRVRSSVEKETDGNQTPWESSSLKGDFYFTGSDVAPSDPSQPEKQEHFEERFYRENVNGAEIEMVQVPGGKFLMGSPAGEGEDDEHPQHEVSVSPFYMGKYEVTQGQWRVVAKLPKVRIDLRPDPANFKGNDDLPVEQVSWQEAIEFCDRLTRTTGKVYRLPTEAEWEYACRAGTKGTHAGTLDEMGWYADNSGRLRLDMDEILRTDKANSFKRLVDNGCRTHPVGQKRANAFGLHDMHGNVWEWCMDWYKKDYYSQSPGSDPQGPNSGSEHVIRSGGWSGEASWSRSARRGMGAPGFRAIGLGFRVVRASR